MGFRGYIGTIVVHSKITLGAINTLNRAITLTRTEIFTDFFAKVKGGERLAVVFSEALTRDPSESPPF